MQISFEDHLYSVENFYFKPTYGDLMIGQPGTDLNQRLFAKLNYPVIWGKRCSMKIAPSVEEMNCTLPNYTCHAWLISDPIKVRNHGSELIISWMVSDADQKISKLVYDVLANIDWNKEAKDFMY